jgi:hypothetical protein
MADLSALASIADEFQARRAELQADVTETFDVPGFEGVLKVRYGLLGQKQIDLLGERIAKIKGLDSTTRRLYLMADTLVLSSVAVYPAKLHDPDKPVDGPKWSPAVASALKIEGATTPRQAVIAVLTARSDTYVGVHYQDVMAWQGGENERVDEELEGESEPPQPSS